MNITVEGIEVESIAPKIGTRTQSEIMGREKRHRTVLFSALKGMAALLSTMAPLMHIPANNEQEVALIPSICSIFICLVIDTDGEKFPGNTMEGIPGGGRTDLETYRAT